MIKTSASGMGHLTNRDNLRTNSKIEGDGVSLVRPTPNLLRAEPILQNHKISFK